MKWVRNTTVLEFPVSSTIVLTSWSITILLERKLMQCVAWLTFLKSLALASCRQISIFGSGRRWSFLRRLEGAGVECVERESSFV